MSTVDVLIVGAGPTGLTLACVLAERNVSFRIIDVANAPPTGSRGKGLQPRSLELLDGLGLAERIIANGRFDLPVQAHGDAGPQSGAAAPTPQPPSPDTPYLTSLITPQWRIEETLRDRLDGWGGHVEYGVGLTAFAQNETGVAASLSGVETLSASFSWLVGCDGGKSAVRHLSGISFLGETLETHRMLVADVQIPSLDRDHWHMWRSPEGFLALCPLPSTDLFQFQGSVAPGQESDTTLDILQRMVERRTGRNDIVLSAPSWISLWRANVRMVDRYRAGRVFLAGDAAHVHSPAGGQGMNTGIQDAFNLGWKLAAVIGGVDPVLLDTYQEERLPIAAGVLRLSNALMASVVATGSMAVRGKQDTTQLALEYRDSSLTVETRDDGPGLRAGDRAPQAPGLRGPRGECSLFDLLRGPHFTVLGFGERWRPVVEACVERFGAGLRAYVVVDAVVDDISIVDGQGAARSAYGHDTLFVIRPDHYVGAAFEVADAGPVLAYLARFASNPRQKVERGGG